MDFRGMHVNILARKMSRQFQSTNVTNNKLINEQLSIQV